MSTKTMIGIATASCACIIVTSLIAVCVIFNEINSLHDDVMDEMGIFRVSTFFESKIFDDCLKISKSNLKYMKSMI